MDTSIDGSGWKILGTDDTKNVSSKLRSGWELVRADEYPGQTFQQLNLENTQVSSDMEA
jgi:hypothetical protein